MSLALAFKIASVLSLVQFAAHASLFLRAKPRHGADEAAVIEAMKSRAFDFRGFKRSYWDLYFGYGLVAAGCCLVEAMLLWQISRFAPDFPSETAFVALTFIVANLSHLALCLRYFFSAPMIFDALIAIALGLGAASAVF